jgi:hypothetical protein
MARTKPAPALRGVELLERVIAKVEHEGRLRPKPVPAEALARLRLPGRRALPASLRRWLALDGSYLGVVARGRPPKLDTRPFVSICRGELSDYEEAWDDFADSRPRRRMAAARRRRFKAQALSGLARLGSMGLLLAAPNLIRRELLLEPKRPPTKAPRAGRRAKAV